LSSFNLFKQNLKKKKIEREEIHSPREGQLHLL